MNSCLYTSKLNKQTHEDKEYDEIFYKNTTFGAEKTYDLFKYSVYNCLNSYFVITLAISISYNRSGFSRKVYVFRESPKRIPQKNIWHVVPGRLQWLEKYKS